MAEGNFPACIAEVARHEGGFVDHPADPGGATNMGITRAVLAEWRGRPVAVAEIRSLTRAEAEAIYHARYWLAVQGEALPRGVDLAVLDAAVNSGPGQAARWLQRDLGVVADGRIGRLTLAAAAGAVPTDLIRRYAARRMGFLQGLRHWPSFGRGWARRVAAVEAAALAMAVAGDRAQIRDAADRAQTRAQVAGAAAASAGGGGGLVIMGDLPLPVQGGLVLLALGLCALCLHRAGMARARAAALAALAAQAEEQAGGQAHV